MTAVPAAIVLGIGAPLLAAGITRRYLAQHPTSVAKARGIGAAVGFTGLIVTVLGGVAWGGMAARLAEQSELVNAIGSNVLLVGSSVGLVGLAIYVEAVRAGGLQRRYEVDVEQASRITVDREHQRRELATLYRGLPRAQIFSYAF